jgi:spheroidene monooxygenase
VVTIKTVSLSFFRFAPGLARVWAFAMMGLARPGMSRIDGIGFWKLCGSGTGEGFTPVPNTGVYAILATWPDLETAQRQISTAKIYQRYRARAKEDWTVFLSPTSVRGQWSGVTPFEADHPADAGPVAALTRATIKPRAALRFWKRVPDISTVIGTDDNVVFKIGIGEVPLLHQVTFSIWPDTTTMANFARADGPHARAIKAVRAGDWFQEELYARFQVTACDGTWNGQPPLKSIGFA